MTFLLELLEALWTLIALVFLGAMEGWPADRSGAW